jgi:hypothetical protein
MILPVSPSLRASGSAGQATDDFAVTLSIILAEAF